MQQTANYSFLKPEDNEAFDEQAHANANMDAIDSQIKARADDLAAHLADNVPHIPYVIASGSANVYAVTLNPVPASYTEGMALAIKINIENTGASTVNVNGLGVKSIKKPNGNDVTAGNLKAGSIYTLRYNGTNFILQGEGGGGDAQPGDVLNGKTFTNDTGEQTGSMPNNGTVNITPGTTNQTIAAGYHDGTGVAYGDADLVAGNIKSGATIFGVSGDSNVVDTSGGDAVAGDILSGKKAYVDGAQVTGTMTDRGTVNYTPSTSNQTVAAGKHSGSGVVYGDADFIAANIKLGVNIYGVDGTFGGVHSSQSYTTPGTYTFTVPAGVNQISFVAVGAGGGGGGARNSGGMDNGSGGGGGGCYVGTMTVTPGQQISVVVGTGGGGGRSGYLNAANGTAGGNSSVGPYIAYGGSGGIAMGVDGGAGGAGGGNGGQGGAGGSAYVITDTSTPVVDGLPGGYGGTSFNSSGAGGAGGYYSSGYHYGFAGFNGSVLITW